MLLLRTKLKVLILHYHSIHNLTLNPISELDPYHPTPCELLPGILVVLLVCWVFQVYSYSCSFTLNVLFFSNLLRSQENKSPLQMSYPNILSWMLLSFTLCPLTMLHLPRWTLPTEIVYMKRCVFAHVLSPPSEWELCQRGTLFVLFISELSILKKAGFPVSICWMNEYVFIEMP